MGLKGRYFSNRDMAFMHSINGELMGDIIQTEVTIFKACAQNMETNIYGETKASQGKQYYPGIEITAMIDRADISTEADDFGPNRKQNVVFNFREKMLKEINFFPQTGDLVLFNERYHEVDEIKQEQFPGGIDDKSWAIAVNTHYTSLSKIDLVERQS
jgi:hypothetical protein